MAVGGIRTDRKTNTYQSVGEVAEWLNAPHSKCGIRVTVSGVRIPPSPPVKLKSFANFRALAFYPLRKTHNPLPPRLANSLVAAIGSALTTWFKWWDAFGLNG